MSLIPEEGAWFALNYVSGDRLEERALPTRYAGTGGRAMANAIYGLITRADFSAMHRLRSDETWHFYGGEAAELLLLHPCGRSEVVRLGPDTPAGDHAQFIVPAGTWMGARPAGDAREAYSFFGCTLAPGFDYADYEPGYREELAAGWPMEADRIHALTRGGYLRRPAGAGPMAAIPVAEPPEPGRVVKAGEARVLDTGAGMTIGEIVGRGAVSRSEAASVTRFRLEAGAGTGSSRYHGADEHFHILAGCGTAEIEGRREAVRSGDTVVIRKGERHALTADAGEALEFLAIIAPAFAPAHYAPEPATGG